MPCPGVIGQPHVFVLVPDKPALDRCVGKISPALAACFTVGELGFSAMDREMGLWRVECVDISS
jgi:hypothetical protein